MIKYLAAIAVIAGGTAEAQYTVTKIAGSRLEVGMPVQSANISPSSGIAWDPQGRFYFSSANRVFRVNTIGVVDMALGNGIRGFSGDGEFATSPKVEFSIPQGLAVDGSGNLYIADAGNARIRKVDVGSGVITTVAGNGGPVIAQSTFPGAGGLATNVTLGYPASIATDSNGDIYVVDNLEDLWVLKISAATGILTIAAGNGQFSSSGDGGLATNAGFQALCVATDVLGNLYICEATRVRKVSAATGIITTLAGNQTYGSTGDGGLATAAEVKPSSLGIDAAGNVYIGSFDYNGIRRITPGGIINTVAGTGQYGAYSGEGGLASQATIPDPALLAVDSSGDILYLGDQGAVPTENWIGAFIFKISGGVITTVAGATTALGDGGPAISGQFVSPQGLAVDGAGNAYVGDGGVWQVRRIDASSGLITSAAGYGNFPGSGGDGGAATSALIGSAFPGDVQVAVDESGNLFLSDDNGKIREVSAQTGVIMTVARTTLQFLPADLVVDSSGIYVSEGGNVEKVAAGNLIPATSIAALPAATGQIDRDASGDFFLTNWSTIGRIASGGGTVVTTIAGTCATNSCPNTQLFLNTNLGDGRPATSATLYNPQGVKVDSSGNIFIADTGNMRVRMVSAATGIISTIAGTNVPGCSGGNFSAPSRLGLDGSGNIYVLDTVCKQVYKLSPPNPNAGNLDIVNCQSVTGWAANRNELNQAITVSIYDGTALLGTVTANLSRPDVGAFLGDNGLHGFSFALPSSVRDGRAHAIHVEYGASSVDLTGSPQSLTCSTGPSYAGNVDSASCSGIKGWVADRNRPNVPIVVSLWSGATQIASTTANLPRPDVGTAIGDNGVHGFSLAIPPAYANGVSHALQVHYETSAVQVNGSPVTLTCGNSEVPNYTGNVDSASCSGIKGWVADRNRPNVPIVVSLWDGATEITSATANGARPDVGTAIGDNGMHGFTLAIPSGYNNGVAHSLQVRYETSAVQVNGSPVSLTCGSGGGSTPNYAGFVDISSCSGIAGWAADRNQLNQAIAVSLWSGGTEIATTTANASRPDVGAAIGDNGLHGFMLQIPSAYANGTSRAYQIRFGTSTTQLTGSPVTMTCGSSGPAPNYVGNLDILNCSTIAGWTADRNALNGTINVSIYDGSTLLETTLAAVSRPDVGTFLGDNGLHGFSVSTPASLKDGNPHTITVRPGASATPLPGPQSLTCQP